MKISYDSSEMLEEIACDIAEFGGNEPAYAVWKTITTNLFGREIKENFIVNYLLSDEDPKGFYNADETAILSTLSEIQKVLILQNEII